MSFSATSAPTLSWASLVAVLMCGEQMTLSSLTSFQSVGGSSA